MKSTVKVGDKFIQHNKMKFEGGYHEFDSECVITMVDKFRAEYEVVRQFNEVNRPSWQTSEMTVSGGGFSLKYGSIVNGYFKKEATNA